MKEQIQKKKFMFRQMVFLFTAFYFPFDRSFALCAIKKNRRYSYRRQRRTTTKRNRQCQGRHGINNDR